MIIFVILVLSPAYLFAEDAKLYFKTSFDGMAITSPPSVRPNIRGTDPVSGDKLLESLPGITLGDPDYISLYGQFRTNVYPECIDTLNDYVIIDVRETAGPKGTPIKALYQETKENPPVKSCYQSTGLTSAWSLKPRWSDTDNRKKLRTVYQRYWTKHHFNNGNSGWRQLSQIKSYDSTGSPRYKWTFYAISLYDKPHQFMLAFEHEYQGDQVNHYPNNDHKQPIYVPQDEWFKYEVFIISSEGDDGLLQFAVNDKIVMEWHGPNMHNNVNSEPLFPGNIRLTGPYGASGYQMTTGLEIWDKPPSDSVLYTGDGSSEPNTGDGSSEPNTGDGSSEPTSFTISPEGLNLNRN